MNDTENFAVLIPISTQVGFDTYRDSYKTLILSKKMNLIEIMEQVNKVKSNATVEEIYFTELILQTN